MASALLATAPVQAQTRPSGKIAFYSGRDGNDEIYIMNADGSRQTRLTNNLATEFNPVLSPNGRMIAFSTDRDHPGVFELYLMHSTGRGVRRLTTDATEGEGNPSWTLSGHKIAFTAAAEGNLAGNPDVYTINLDGSGLTNLTNSPELDAQPNYSPDGRYLAFMRDYDIYVMRADGSNVTRLTTDGATNEWPHWSPSGKQLTFHSTRDGSYEVYTMIPDGSDVHQVTDQGVPGQCGRRTESTSRSSAT
jgi:TolB protein